MLKWYYIYIEGNSIYNKQGKTSKKVINDDVLRWNNEHCIYLAVQSEIAFLKADTHSSK